MGIADWSDPALERRLVESVTIDEPWALVERFAQLERIDGSADEWTAAYYVAGRLSSWGIPHHVYEPDLYLSIPRRAKVWLRTDDGVSQFDARPASFSPSTAPEIFEAEALYLPPDLVRDLLPRLGTGLTLPEMPGRIVLLDGFFSADGAELARELGAAGAIFLNPGVRVHEGAGATHWGAPDLDSLPRRRIPIAGVNSGDGAKLRAAAETGRAVVAIETECDEGFYRCPIVVAEIPGTFEPHLYVLLHGHIDGWYQGVGDNATGDALLLEVARVLWLNRSELRRSVRVAWWPGHSQGRYAGSTWYADQFGLDLAERAIAHVNCDSPGCRWATDYRAIHWMPEAEILSQSSVESATGQAATGAWPWRAGDWSFSNIGVTGLFGLSSQMTVSRLEELGYYPTGGCGGSIVWHTPDDTLEIADRDNLLRDIKVYLTLVARLANAPIHPLDFRATVVAIHNTLEQYREAANSRVDFSDAVEAAAALRDGLERWYNQIESGAFSPSDVNQRLRKLARTLNPVLYTRRGPFRQDPARTIAPLPDLAPARLLADPTLSRLEEYAIQTEIRRGQNRLTAALEAANALIAEL